MYFLNPKFQVSSYLLWLYSLLWVGLFWTCASWLGCPLLKILMNNLLVGVICFISTLYINWRVNMVIVSRLEGMGIFSACRVIIIIIISIFKEDNIFSITASLPYGPPVNTDIDYYQTFFGLVYFCKCCEVSCAIFKYFLTKHILTSALTCFFTQRHLAVTSWHFVLSPN